jgi:uncharacterized protein (TIGR02145 family)
VRIDGSQNQTNNTTIEKYCYNDLETQCNIYHGLYQWNELMNYTTSSNANPSGRQGICPANWHIPSYAEYDQLTVYLLGYTVAGGKMKETGTTHWLAPNTAATNSSGFTALPGGWRDIGAYHDLNESGFIYTSTEYSPSVAYFAVMTYSSAELFMQASELKVKGFGVRCVKDPPEKLESSESDSLKDSGKPVIIVYPNPTPGVFTLELDGKWTQAEKVAVISDMLGHIIGYERVRGSGKFEFSLTGMPPGIYVVRVTDGKDAGSAKIVKVN